MSKTQLPSLGELRRARDRFASMLTQKTVEPDWQRLFEACPFILSTALPLKLSPLDIIPAGRPGQSEADFMIQSQFGPSEGLYGVIDLKKPSTRILTARPPRQGLLQLSSQIATGVTQAHLYVASLESRVDLLDSFFMGNRRHLFLIAGMSDDLVTQVTSDLLPLMQQQLRGCDLWTFDRLLKAFESQIALPPFYLLQPLLQQMMIRKKDGSRERFDRMKVI